MRRILRRRSMLELANLLPNALDAMHRERHTALILQRPAKRCMQTFAACDQLVESEHAGDRPRQLCEQRDSRIRLLRHLLHIERARLDHACDAEDREALFVEAVKHIVLAVLQRFFFERRLQLRTWNALWAREAQRDDLAP